MPLRSQSLPQPRVCVVRSWAICLRIPTLPRPKSGEVVALIENLDVDFVVFCDDEANVLVAVVEEEWPEGTFDPGSNTAGAESSRVADALVESDDGISF